MTPKCRGAQGGRAWPRSAPVARSRSTAREPARRKTATHKPKAMCIAGAAKVPTTADGVPFEGLALLYQEPLSGSGTTMEWLTPSRRPVDAPPLAFLREDAGGRPSSEVVQRERQGLRGRAGHAIIRPT